MDTTPFQKQGDGSGYYGRGQLSEQSQNYALATTDARICPLCKTVTPPNYIRTLHRVDCPGRYEPCDATTGVPTPTAAANTPDGRKPVRLFDHQVLALLRAEIEALQELVSHRHARLIEDNHLLTRQKVLHHIEELQRLAEALPESLTR